MGRYRGRVAPPEQRVLVVEDDPSIARLLEVELADAGYDVDLAATGAAGLAAIEREEPAVVVLDVRLPDLDGLSVCRQARRERPLHADPDADGARPGRRPRASASTRGPTTTWRSRLRSRSCWRACAR